MRATPSKRNESQPFYLPIADEVEVFHAAYDQRLPVLLKGPTGCGKTRFVEHMAWKLVSPTDDRPNPLITVACNEDLTASDLVGRYLIKGDELWLIDQDAPPLLHGSFGDTSVVFAPDAFEKGLIGRILDQAVAESVMDVRMHARLAQQFSRHQRA